MKLHSHLSPNLKLCDIQYGVHQFVFELHALLSNGFGIVHAKIKQATNKKKESPIVILFTKVVERVEELFIAWCVVHSDSVRICLQNGRTQRKGLLTVFSNTFIRFLCIGE